MIIPLFQVQFVFPLVHGRGNCANHKKLSKTKLINRVLSRDTLIALYIVKDKGQIGLCVLKTLQIRLGNSNNVTTQPGTLRANEEKTITSMFRRPRQTVHITDE